MEQCGEICFYKNYQDNSFSFLYSLSLLNKIRTEKKRRKKTIDDVNVIKTLFYGKSLQSISIDQSSH
jgi:hypothetical protein